VCNLAIRAGEAILFMIYNLNQYLLPRRNNSINTMEEITALLARVPEYLAANRTKIFIGTPCYAGLAHCGYLQSMIELAINFTKLGIPFENMVLGNESLIPRARNGIVARFYADIDATHLLFIDADITFSWISVVKLLLSGKDLSGGCYPKKMINWTKVRQTLKDAPDVTDEILLAKSLDYVFNPVYYKEGNNMVCKIDRGMVKVKDIGTGFMMIKKDVIFRMMQQYPELQYKNNVAGYDVNNENKFFYALFNTEIDANTRVFLSEDYLFCKRWIEMGGELWLDLGTNLNHSGTMDFKGCIGLNINTLDILNKDAEMMNKK
jgi:hypothetical protein